MYPFSIFLLIATCSGAFGLFSDFTKKTVCPNAEGKYCYVLSEKTKTECYLKITQQKCCQKCKDLIDDSIPGCPFGDFTKGVSTDRQGILKCDSLKTCADCRRNTGTSNCCKTCHRLCAPPSNPARNLQKAARFLRILKDLIRS